MFPPQSDVARPSLRQTDLLFVDKIYFVKLLAKIMRKLRMSCSRWSRIVDLVERIPKQCLTSYILEGLPWSPRLGTSSAT